MIYLGDALECLAEIPEASCRCCVTSLSPDPVESLGLLVASLHRAAVPSGSRRASDVAPSGADSVGLASGLERTQVERVSGLWALDEQKRQEGAQGRCSLPVSHGPGPERAAVAGARSHEVEGSPEGLLEKCRDLRGDVPKHDTFRVGRLFRVLRDPNGVGAALDSYRSIRVNRSSQVGECGILHVSNNTTGEEVMLYGRRTRYQDRRRDASSWGRS